MLRRLTIRAKLIASFLVLALASALVGAFGLSVTGALTEEVRDLCWNRLPSLQGLGNAHEGFTRMRALTTDGLVAAIQRDEPGMAAAWRGREMARTHAMNGMAKFGELTMTPEEETLWKRVDPAFQAYLLQNTEAWQVLRAHELDRAAELLRALAARSEPELVEPLQQLTELESQIGDQLMVKADELAARTRRTLWTAVALAFAMATLLAVLLPRTITRPLRALSDVALRIAEGDLTQDVAVEAQDEVGTLAESFRRMVARLREIVSTLKTTSQGLAGAAERLSDHTRAQSAMLERQASSVAETSTTTRELEQTSAVAASRAASVLEVAQRGAVMSESGRVAAERSLEELTRIQGAVEGIIGQSTHLLDQARQIGDIVETVRDLATQSHVLSLNASIEAAKAGEAGRSFAVVAQEVRALAEQSGEGAGRIARMVQDILAAVQSSREMTEKGTRGMAGSLDQIRSSGESLREIGGIVRETSEAALQIAGAVQQQSTGVAQIAVAMHDLDKGMEDTVGQIRSLEQSAQQVAEAATRISGIAEQFRI